MAGMDTNAAANWAVRIASEGKSADVWQSRWGWMVDAEHRNPDAAADEEVNVSNTNMICARDDIKKPEFQDPKYLKEFYKSMDPQEKFDVPRLSSHKVGWRAYKPIEIAALAPRYGKVDARLITDKPLMIPVKRG